MTDEELVNLIDDLPDHVAGPLHIIVEDCNVEMYWLKEQRKQCIKQSADIGVKICEGLMERSIPDRIRILGFPAYYIEYINDDLENDA